MKYHKAMASPNKAARVNGYEKTYETVAPRLRGLDFPYAERASEQNQKWKRIHPV
jgi:hypothetical protein